MTTIKDIAKRLGVSTSTVSKGLNGGRDISDVLRQQILETAVEMGYTSKHSRKPEHRTLALFIENMEYEEADQFGYEIVLGFRQAAYKENWNVELLPITAEFQETHRYDTLMLESGYSASFALGFALDDPWMKQFETTTFNTILLDNFILGNPKVGYVGTDNDEAMELIIRHLISLGHEKIAFLDGSPHSLVSDQRMGAYLKYMKQYHLQIDPNLAVYGYFVANAAKYHVPGFLQLGATAIICGNDAIASGAIASCIAEGYSVPDDVSIVGFDDLPFAAHLTPALTTIRQNRLAVGKSAVYALHAMLNECELSRSQLRPELITRASVSGAKPRLVTNRTTDKDSVLYVNPQLYAQHAYQQF